MADSKSNSGSQPSFGQQARTAVAVGATVVGSVVSAYKGNGGDLTKAAADYQRVQQTENRDRNKYDSSSDD